MKNEKSHTKMYHKNKKRMEAPICPYCGRRSVLRPAEYIYGEDTITPGSYLYVCSGYPSCKAYVGVLEGTKKPKGSLADPELRNKRIRAHRALEKIVNAGCMSRKDVYLWLACRLNLPEEQTHIGIFSDYLCEQVIRECEAVTSNWEGKAGKHVA